MDPTTTTTTTTKLRLMCSYGGHIAPRPHAKTLTYIGGDTRMVSVDSRTTATISSLSHHLSSTLLNGRPFTLKYQLPHHDLDSLVSVSDDQDLVYMLEEIDAVSEYPKPCRIRLFLFPARVGSTGSIILGRASEPWLESPNVLPKVGSHDSGSGRMDSVDLNSGSDSVLFEINSSFGSASSSLSDNNAASSTPHQQNILNQDPVVSVASMDHTPLLKPIDLESNISNFPNRTHMEKTVQNPDYLSSPQYFHAVPYYIQEYPTGLVPQAHYYPVYHYQPNQPNGPSKPDPIDKLNQPTAPNQSDPFYLFPVRQTQPHHTIASSRPPLHPNSVSYKELVEACTSKPELALSTGPLVPLIQVDPNQVQEQFVGTTQMDQIMASMESANYGCSDLDSDWANTQIYKSQPTGPTPPSQYQSIMVSETLKRQLHIHTDDN